VAIARDRNRAGSNRHTIPFSVPLRFWRPNGHGEKGRTVPIARIRVLPQYEAMMLRGAEMRGQMEPEARSPGLQIDAIAGRRGD